MPGIKSTIKDTRNINWTYQEISQSRNRGLHIWGSGGNFSRIVRPDPHSADSKYYNKKQVKWYQEAAEQTINFFVENGNWPSSIEVNGYTYTYQ
ncbi:hypothetical protein [Colwellia echini]|uniref:Uncharacterized protein n=1 Tax=Colwellia echini TaxID=1982103 RepID=A0ABY3MWH1_9GAMM|nr:hypothetical protein [Colwellia echini]TYK65427.1 hypothetical protein CWS31_010040 [Colwellia echini]